MKKTLLILIILLTIILFPKVNAEMLRLNDETITKFDETMISKIYKFGTKINISNTQYTIYYMQNQSCGIGIYSSSSSDTENPYIGYINSNVNLKHYSEYWYIYDYDERDEIITMMPIQSKVGICNVDVMEIGDVCFNRSKMISAYGTQVEYYDSNNQLIGMRNSPQTGHNEEDILIGSLNDDTILDITEGWKLKEAYISASLFIYKFEPSDTTIKDNVNFSLTCDKEKINYKDKTLCHFNVKQYLITSDPIILTLEEKDDLELIKTIPSEFFKVENQNNVITITPKYISTTIEENIELFSFEVKAKKEKNEINNIEVKDISYYDGETYTNLKTTINIENRSFLSSNPLTANPTLFKILLVSVLLLISSSLLIKKQRT